MKKALILIALIAGVALAWAAPPDRLPNLLTPPAEARMTSVVVGGGVPAAGAACTVKDTFAPSYNAYGAIDADTSYGFRFTTSSSAYTVTQVSLFLSRNGAASGTITAYIYAGSSTGPTGSALATSTNTISVGTLSDGTATEVKFQFAGLSLSGSTVYYVVVDSNNFTGNVKYWVDTALTLDHGDMWSNYLNNWTDANDMQVAIKTWTGTCP